MLPPCPHRPECPGCPRFGDSALAPRAIAALSALATETGVHLEQLASTPRGFRHRARLAVRGGWRAPKIGIFRTGTHQAVDIPHCPIHHPVINEISAALGASIIATQTSVYSDRTHRGLVRYVQIAVERSTETAQVVLVTNSDSAAPAEALLDALTETAGARLHSLWWNGNPARTNSILGPCWKHCGGLEAVVESIGGAQIFFPPGAFGQSHLPLFDAIVTRIHTWVGDSSPVAEYYAGVGAIGLGLLDGRREVRFNEVSEDSVAGLRLGLHALPETAGHAVVRPGRAGATLELLEGADTVIVDPPRKGLEPVLRDRLGSREARQLVYLACGLDAFLRDTEALRGRGWALTELVAANLFPYTDHVETLARFVRSG